MQFKEICAHTRTSTKVECTGSGATTRFGIARAPNLWGSMYLLVCCCEAHWQWVHGPIPWANRLGERPEIQEISREEAEVWDTMES